MDMLTRRRTGPSVAGGDGYLQPARLIRLRTRTA